MKKKGEPGKAYYVITIVIDAILFLFMLLGIWSWMEEPDRFPLSMIIMLALMPLSWMILSALGLIKKWKLAPVISAKITLFFFFFGLNFLGYEDGIYAIIVFGLFALLMGVITFGLWKAEYGGSGVKVHGRTGNLRNVEKPKSQFCYKGKWAWDLAYAEYLEKTGKAGSTGNIESTESRGNSGATDQAGNFEDGDMVYCYAMMPVVYYFYWFLKRGFMSEGFYAQFSKERVQECLSHQVTPLDLLRDMDYCVQAADLQEEALRSTEPYFTARYFSLEEKVFLFDYWEEIQNPQRFFYAVDFSWEACERLYQKIDKVYEEVNSWGRWNGKCYEDDEEAGKKIYSERSKREIEVRRMGEIEKNNIGDAFLEKCVKDYDSISDAQFKRLDRLVREVYGDMQAGEVMQNAEIDELWVFEPEKEGDLAYVASGSAEFEQEHGFSFTVRNGVIYEWGYGYDFENPYDEKSKLAYEIAANTLDFEKVQTKEQVALLVAEGKLIRTMLRPKEFGGKDEASNYVYITPLALQRKELMDWKLGALLARDHGKTEFSYEAEYDDAVSGEDKQERVIPKSISVRENVQLGKASFKFRVTVWI